MTLIKNHYLNILTGTLFLVAFATLGTNPAILGVLPFIFGGVMLSVIDFRYHRLPTRLVYYTLAGVSAGLAVASLIEWDWKPAALALAGALLYAWSMAAVYVLGTKFLGMKIIGFGDVRLALILGALLGWWGLDNLIYGAIAAVFVAFPFAVVKLIQTRKLTVNIAFGPALMIGCLLVVLAH